MKLVTKFTLIVLVLISILSLTAFLAFSYHKKALQESIARQQFLMISELANGIDNRLLATQQDLISIAKATPSDIMKNPEKAQVFLDSRPILHRIFDNRVYLFTPLGKIFVESPNVSGRRGLDLSFREYITNTLNTKQPYISDPFESSQPHKHPVIMFTVPLFDLKGQITGILGGSIDLMRDNFLGGISSAKIGDSGYLILTATDRTLIMHPDKKRILTKQATGLNRLYDKAIEGYEGTDETITSYGVEMLSSFKRLKAKNWILAAHYPQAEAYRPIQVGEHYFLMIAVICIIAVFIFITFITRYLIQPLQLFTRHVEDIPQKTGDDRFLNIKSKDEIGTLSLAFNQMMIEVDKRSDLERSEELYRTVMEFSTDFIFWRAPDNKIIYVSENCEKFCGYTEEELYASPELLETMVHPDDVTIWSEHVHDISSKGVEERLELRIITKSGQVRWIAHNCLPVFDKKGNYRGRRASHQDITRQKEATKTLNQLSTAIEQTSDWILVTDRQGKIEYANSAVERITGYKKEEILGKNPSIFKSGKYSREFYEKMWGTILSGQIFSGIMTNRRKDGELFEVYHTVTPVKDSSGEITHFVANSKDITAMKQLEEQINFLATHDEHTGLPNRALFVDRLRQVLARSGHDKRFTGIVFIDVDRLQLINDAFGAQVGDAFLVEIGKRLQTATRDGDTIARFGSDEFAISLIDVAKSDDIILILEYLRKVLSSPFKCDGVEALITFSIGVSIHPTDSKDINAVIENAVIACQKVKGLGGNDFQFFTPDMNSKAFEFVSMERHMFDAIRNEEFILHYQPYYDMATLELVGMEALVRWRHDDGGLVPPGQFIPVLEETGMIIEVGKLVLREAVRQVREWQDKGYPVVPVSVNLSPVQFKQKDLVEIVKGIVQEYGLSPSLVVMEITESAFMENLEFTKQTLKHLRELGISISIDDFGTGYSSLSYLKRFPIDNLKIDISFIRDLGRHQDAESIVKAIITMGHALNLKTIAEGIESEEQWTILQSMECTVAQGFYCSKPLAAPEFEKLFEEHVCHRNRNFQVAHTLY